MASAEQTVSKVVKHLQQYREKRGISVYRIARDTGLSASGIHALEKGLVSDSPSVWTGAWQTIDLRAYHRRLRPPDRLLTRTDENGHTLGYRYYSSGKLKTLIYPGGTDSGTTGRVDYTYWPGGHPTRRGDWSRASWNFSPHRPSTRRARSPDPVRPRSGGRCRRRIAVALQDVARFAIRKSTCNILIH